MFDPTSMTPRRMTPQRSAAGRPPLGWRACPRPPSTSPAPGSSSPTPPNAGQRFRCDLTWLTSSLDVHLRHRLQGHLRRPPRRRLLHPGRALHRRGRREAGAGRRRAELRRGRVAAPRRGTRQGPAGSRPRRRTAPARPGSSTAPASSSTGPASPAARAARCTSTPLRHRAARRYETKPDVCWQLPIRRTYARRRPDDTSLPRGDDRRVRPPRLGPGRPRPRLVLLRQHRGARRREPVFLSNAPS